MTVLGNAVHEAEMFLASYDAAMEDPEQNHALVAQQDAMPLAESLRSVLAALSTPPPDYEQDERVAAWMTIAKHPFFADCFRDGVLIDHIVAKLDALSTPPADDVRKELARTLEDHQNSYEPVDTQGFEGYADAILSRFEVRPHGTVTDAEVQRLREAIYRQSGNSWYPTPEQGRIALEAVYATRRTE